ncbi:MAG: hypothetical protein M0Z69_08955 [Actinomycetota bacterium]|nr:hypothetical protein [Actinomycetota bacterium]
MTPQNAIPAAFRWSSDQLAEADRKRQRRLALVPNAEPVHHRIRPGTRKATAVPTTTVIEKCIERAKKSLLISDLDKLLGGASTASLKMIFTGLDMLAEMQAPHFYLTDVHALLMSLPKKYQRQLGVITDTGRLVSYIACWRRMNKLERKLVKTEAFQHLSIDEALTYIGNKLALIHLESQGVRPEEIFEAALDSSSLETWAKVRIDESLPKDDKRWTKDEEAGPNHWPAKNGRHSETRMGFDWQALVQVSGNGIDGRPRPGVIFGFQFSYPNKGGCEYLRLLDRAAAVGIRLKGVRADLGVANLVNDYEGGNFQVGLAERGIRLVHKLTETQKKPAPAFRGAPWVRSNLCCPCSWHAQNQLPPIDSNLSSEEKAGLIARYDAAAAHFFAVRQRAGVRGGGVRLECPARRGTVRCPLVNRSMTLPSDKFDTIQPPTNMRTQKQIAEVAAVDPEAAASLIPAPDCCEQETMTLPATVEPGRHQWPPYGTTEHVQQYGQRNLVEGAYGDLKTNIGSLRRGSYRYFGKGIPALFTAFMVIAVNQRLIDSFDYRHGIDEG